MDTVVTVSSEDVGSSILTLSILKKLNANNIIGRIISPMHKSILNQIGIENVYETKESFLLQYPFDENNSDSIISNLNRAYDNAIVMRDYIGTETMAYIQLAIDDIHNANRNITTIADLVLAIDHILAFWGCVNDMIDNEQIRNIIKLGKGLERLDLYLSLDLPDSDIIREYRRMKQFLAKSKLRYDEGVINTADSMTVEPPLNHKNLKNLLRNLITE